MDNNNNEQFGDFMNCPTFNELMQDSQCEVDNKLLYKKLIELQNEIQEMRLEMKNLLYYKQIYYPTQMYQSNIYSKISPINNAKKQI
jgi:hypothetical protein